MRCRDYRGQAALVRLSIRGVPFTGFRSYLRNPGRMRGFKRPAREAALELRMALYVANQPDGYGKYGASGRKPPTD